MQRVTYTIKRCSACKLIKQESFFNVDNSNKSKLSSQCKQCKHKTQQKYLSENKEKVLFQVRAYRDSNKERINARRVELYNQNYEHTRAIRTATNVKRRANQLKQTPQWADLEKIAQVYEYARHLQQQYSNKYHVDHIIPLQGKYVRGLHTAENLQIIDALSNMYKGNRLTDTEPVATIHTHEFNVYISNRRASSGHRCHSTIQIQTP